MLFWDGGKAPAEVADYDVDWTARLNGATITASSWAITGGDAPASGTLAINNGAVFSSTITKVTLSGGNLGVTYTLVNTVQLSVGGAPLVESIQLPVRNPVVVGNLTTLANAMQWLGKTSDPDGYIARLVAAISTQIQNFLSYNVLAQSYSRVFDGQGTRKFFVPDIPLISVQSLTIDGVTIPKGTPGTNNPGFYNNTGSINLFGYYFTCGFQNIATTYTAGFTTVPADIEQACLDWTKNVYLSGKMISMPSNVVSVSAGDTSFSFGKASGSTSDPALIQIPPTIYAVLLTYQRVTQVSGW